MLINLLLFIGKSLVVLKVSKAVEFLIDGSIQQTPIERKVNFLRSKGLTDHEITVSLQRAAARCNQNSYTINASLFVSHFSKLFYLNKLTSMCF